MFTVENLKEFLKQASLGIADAKDMLTQLDAQAGDGDLGVNMEQGFKAVAEAVGAQSLGIILQIAGFNGEAAMQSATALAWVENSFAVIPALLMIGSAYMIYKYPVSKRVYNDVVKAIESREAGIMPDMKKFENLM